MARRFTAASSELITVGNAAALAGLRFTFGTIAALIYRSADTGTWEAMMSTNAGGFEWDINNGDLLTWYDGAIERTGMTVPTATPLVLASTKATGTATSRHHMYRFDTNTWTHQDSASANANAPATSSMVIGSSAATDFLSSEIWALGMWPKLAMSDAVVERLARGRWLETEPDFYEQFIGSHEVGDMLHTLGRMPTRQTARTGTTRGVTTPPPGFRFGPVHRRR